MKAAAPAPIGFAALREANGEALRHALAGDPVQAARWLLAAARYGLVEAQVVWGQCLLDGRGVARDAQAAFGWFDTAATAGHVPAINMVGRCCERGWGTEVDLSRAVACYRRAADAGYDWGEYNLANMMLRGRGMARDRAGARALFARAAGQGHAKAMNLLGRFWEEGWVGPADPKVAAAWYFRSAQGGDFRGQYNLASLLALHGRVAEAVLWLRRAQQTATPEFLALMAVRLAGSDHPALRQIAKQCVTHGSATAPPQG